MRGALADDHGHFGLALEDRCGHVGQHHGVPGPMIAVAALWKALIGAGFASVPFSM